MRWNNKYAKGFGGMLFMLLLHTIAIGQKQKKDSLLLLKEFVSVNAAYQQMPLYLKLEIRTINVPGTGQGDTAAMEGEFFLHPDNSYVHFGEFEQLVNDSLALLVSNELQQMILYTNAGPIVAQMKRMMGASLPDSSVQKLGERYKSAATEAGEIRSIMLESRLPIYSTSMPKERIELRYDKKTKMPLQVITIQRQLIKIDSIQFAGLGGMKAYEGYLIHVGEGYFMIQEKMTTYEYKKVEQATLAKIPVLLSDRIRRTETGEYIPVPGFASYKMTIND